MVETLFIVMLYGGFELELHTIHFGIPLLLEKKIV
jgi:hypothetical protein